MQRYNEWFKCRACGHSERHTIIAYGDYDGPDEPRELSNCIRCETLKEGSPKVYERLKLMSNQISDLKLKNKVYKNAIHKIRRGFWEDFSDGENMRRDAFLEFEKKINEIIIDAEKH